MPRELFNTISNEKKQRIYLAAKQEFIKYPYEDVSINRICKAANISRGSFYLYFENKLDLYYFCYDQIRDLVKQRIRTDVYSHYTLFNLCVDIFDYIMSFYSTSESKFYERIIYNLNEKILAYFVEQTKKQPPLNLDLTLLRDYCMLDIKDDHDVEDIIGICRTLTNNMIFNVFKKEISIENARTELIRKLGLVKKAAYKVQEN